ncbi:hypothetical protein EVC30_040 [Rhizobium phage RHph_Y1_11]|nr:hypothetical protein EVC30_040 [Rhizobium phage RHph_Y1_11]
MEDQLNIGSIEDDVTQLAQEMVSLMALKIVGAREKLSCSRSRHHFDLILRDRLVNSLDLVLRPEGTAHV